MKKIHIPIFILSFVLIISGILIVDPENNSEPLFLEYIFIGAIVLFMSLGIYFTLQRIKRKEQGFPEDDELSVKISRDASSISYYVSLFLWLILILLQNKINVDYKWLFAFGIIGMSLIYIISLLIINLRGTSDEK